MKKWIIAFILLQPSLLLAEYRAFVLQITSADGQSTRSITSTLDPDQYPGYFPLEAGEKISYTQTWMCRGRTGDFQKICDNPKLQQSTTSEPTATP